MVKGGLKQKGGLPIIKGGLGTLDETMSHYRLLKIWPWNFQEIIWALLQFIVMLKFSSKPHRAVTVGLLNDTRWWFGGQTSSPKSVCMYFWQSLSFTPPPLWLWLGGNKSTPLPPLWLWLGGQTSNPKSVSIRVGSNFIFSNSGLGLCLCQLSDLIGCQKSKNGPKKVKIESATRAGTPYISQNLKYLKW